MKKVRESLIETGKSLARVDGAKKRVASLETLESDGPRLEVGGRSASYQVLRHRLELWILRYSCGDPLRSLSQRFLPVVGALDNHARASSKCVLDLGNLDDYLTALWMASIARLLGGDPYLMGSIAGMIGCPGQDALYENIVRSVIPERPEARSCLHGEAFTKLAALGQAEPQARQVIARQYLDAWLFTTRFAWFAGLHRRDAERFFGYWAFELAAMVQITDCADDSFARHIIYPRDLLGRPLVAPLEDENGRRRTNTWVG